MQRKCANTKIPAPAPTVNNELMTEANGSLPSEKTDTPAMNELLGSIWQAMSEDEGKKDYR